MPELKFLMEYVINIGGLIAVATVVGLSMVVATKMQAIKKLQSDIADLKKSLDEMDEQAKLVVRTDIELNKTQEELDKKIGGLYALQRFSRVISTALEEEQIFRRMDSNHLEDLGFEKACALLYSEGQKTFSLKLTFGFEAEQIHGVKSFIDGHLNFFLDLIRREKTLSSISASIDTPAKDRLTHVFGVHSFIISPILPKEGDKGLLFVGTQNPDAFITEGEEEVITILANQLGQALENARLFEKTWRQHQDLEKKVEERTRELTAALEEVKKISQRKTDFISSVSHELRTPLTSIKGYASILLAGKLGQLPKDVYERLDKINRHSDELAHMVNDLLDISRIEAGRMTMKFEEQNLNHIVAAATDLLSVQAKEKQIELSTGLPAGANAVFADKSQIERVFINIIANAVKFTPPKGKIKIISHKTDNMVQVDITDTGCGIPQEAQELIFEEFYRVDNPINQEVKGTGLGLALVRHIIEAHKGKIWVKSKVGQGSTFSFTLPIERAAL
ncbi:MAG: GAF domain-containing sensor histidine kinase [Candidatus Omnitrophota bacterium]